MKYTVSCTRCSKSFEISKSSYSERQRGRTSGMCRSCVNAARSYPGMSKLWKSGVLAGWTKSNARANSGLKDKNPARYDAVHRWIKKMAGTPQHCDSCGTDVAAKFEWANLSGNYLKDRSDWMRLCTSCHRKYDMQLITLPVLNKGVCHG